MTKKDYERIAEALREALEFDGGEYADHEDGVISASLRIADALADENPRFDRERFLKAVGADE